MPAINIHDSVVKVREGWGGLAMNVVTILLYSFSDKV